MISLTGRLAVEANYSTRPLRPVVGPFGIWLFDLWKSLSTGPWKRGIVDWVMVAGASIVGRVDSDDSRHANARGYADRRSALGRGAE